MTLIDHQILIPASQTKVWATLSDLQQNPLWQANCKAVSILTTMKNGQGTRWRSTTKSGREQVIEITAWYDRLGYEYRIVDGSPLQNNKGLFRLQEIPEGTIVQWTFSYDPAGFLSGLQDSLRTRRQLDSEITDSLRQLYRLNSSRSAAAANASIETKSLMRAAPDVEARAQYQPRHPSNIEEAAADTGRNAPYRMNRGIARPSVESQPTIAEIPEPAIEEGDTRPNVAVAQVTQTAPRADTDAPYRPPAPAQETVPVQTTVNEPTEQVTAAAKPTPLDEPTPLPAAERPTSETPAIESPPLPREIPPAPVPDKPVMEWFENDISSQIDTRELDTAKISVFELFGIPKPSDSEPIARFEPPQLTESSELVPAVTDTPVAETTSTSSVDAISEPPAAAPITTSAPIRVDIDNAAAPGAEPIGLRWSLRRRTANVRRPTIR